MTEVSRFTGNHVTEVSRFTGNHVTEVRRAGAWNISAQVNGERV